MGRMRIKKKDAVIPFRETLAYRMMLAGGSLVVFIVALYVLVGAISTSMAAAIGPALSESQLHSGRFNETPEPPVKCENNKETVSSSKNIMQRGCITISASKWREYSVPGHGRLACKQNRPPCLRQGVEEKTE